MSAKQIFLALIYLSLLGPISAQSNLSLSGYIRDSASGEALIGATVSLRETNSQDSPVNGTVTNVYGYYNIPASPGEYVISYSYLGFQTKTVTLIVNESIS
ncbi:MAG: carboxypeptidase regulatory-like domain-containing protein, partial [Bacteroidota bacterium]